jgi:transcriptional regulator with XRE-family HTH domain
VNLHTIGRLIAEQRRRKGLTLQELADAAGVGRSTLAALERGKIAELGFGKVARLCTAVDLIMEVRSPTLEAPLMPHRHLTEVAGRELTKAAIEEIITRGEFSTWRGLVRAMRADKSGRIARRVREVTAALGKHDTRARAFGTLLAELMRETKQKRKSHGPQA